MHEDQSDGSKLPDLFPAPAEWSQDVEAGDWGGEGEKEIWGDVPAHLASHLAAMGQPTASGDESGRKCRAGSGGQGIAGGNIEPNGFPVSAPGDGPSYRDGVTQVIGSEQVLIFLLLKTCLFLPCSWANFFQNGGPFAMRFRG
jgi:hypothetical protein